MVWRPALALELRPWWSSRPAPPTYRWPRMSGHLAGFGFGAALIADAGVAGLHRLLAHVEALQAADAVVVVAGMEGALASVVGRPCSAPVVAVPTSVGYGAGLGGVTALLAMLASCASGLVVVGYRQRLRRRLRGGPHAGSGARSGPRASSLAAEQAVP